MKQRFILFFSFLLLIIFISTYYSFFYLPQKRQQQIAQIKQNIQQLKKEIEEIKKFDVENYSEKIVKQLSLDNYYSTSTDIELEGVEIIPKENSKLVINHIEGYQIEIPKNLILNQSRNTNALHFDDPEIIKLGPPNWRWTVISIFSYDKNKNEDEKEDYYRELKRISKESLEIVTSTERIIEKYEKPEFIKGNYVDIYKITITSKVKEYFMDEPDIIKEFHYIVLRNGKLYLISSPEKYENFVKTFKFINE